MGTNPTPAAMSAAEAIILANDIHRLTDSDTQDIAEWIDNALEHERAAGEAMADSLSLNSDTRSRDLVAAWRKARGL